MRFYLHGSMSTEVVPEAVMRAFFETYPDVYPTKDFTHIGAIPDPEFGWPVGFSRVKVDHLGGLTSLGINCAVCHTTELSAPGEPKVRVLGVAGLFDAEAYFGSVVISTFRTQDPANMKKFLWAYSEASNQRWAETKDAQEARQRGYEAAWQQQLPQITAAMAADPSGARGAGAGGLQALAAGSLAFNADADSANQLPVVAVNMLKLFHNMRTALHVPDQIPEKAPPMSGPGRNDAFGLLSAGLFNSVQPYGPVKYGIVWNLEKRGWVHWDGNTPSPLARNILAALGLGAPLVGNEGKFDMKLVAHQTEITEMIRPPRYPYAVDWAAAARGKVTYEANCVACHTGGYGDDRLYSVEEVKTDPTRAKLFTLAQAEGFNKFLGGLKSPGYVPASEGLRSTGKYYAPSLAGVWARSPYLHNGSVRTITELLMPPEGRAATFHRGSSTYDTTNMGFVDEGAYILDTRSTGNSNSGHDYGTRLTPEQKKDLIEYLKQQ